MRKNAAAKKRNHKNSVKLRAKGRVRGSIEKEERRERMKECTDRELEGRKSG